MPAKFSLNALVMYKGIRNRVIDILSTEDYHLYKLNNTKELVPESMLTDSPKLPVPKLDDIDINVLKQTAEKIDAFRESYIRAGTYTNVNGRISYIANSETSGGTNES